MTGSVEALEQAELPKPEAQLSEATVHQQQAYRLLLRLQPKDAQVRQSRSQSGGGAGGASNRPDIQALELDRNRNFYEEENRTQEELQATEEVLNKIKQLAQRQQIINEEIARLISELQNAASEEERERLQRKLDRLEEEQKENLERLDEVQQALASGQLGNRQSNDAREALQRARRQMNESLEQLQQDRLQQARASGARAMQALRDIKESLKQFSRTAAAERMKDLLENMDRITEEQQAVLDEAQRLRDEHDSPSFDDQEEMDLAREGLLEKKAQLSEDFVEMMSEASELAERARETQELMARELGDWLRETSREGILEDISDSRQLVHYGIWDSAVMEEQKIARKLDDAAEKLKEVARNSVEDDIEGMQKALEYLDQILDGEERTRVAANSGEEGDGSRQDREEVGSQSQQDSAEAESNDGSPSQSSGQTGQPSDQTGQPRQEGQPGGRQGGADSRRASAQFGGPDAGNWDLAMRQFAQGGYQRWLERLRDAEALLPRDVPYREQVVRIREEVETIRRRWRERALTPRFDLFLEMVVRPLENTAEQLQRDIERRLNENEFILVDEGEIPERYKEKVADYFKKLSESGRKG